MIIDTSRRPRWVMWLQSHDKDDIVGRFDLVEGRIERLSRGDLGSRAPDLSVMSGWFSDNPAGTFILYARKGAIFFRFDDEEITLDRNTRVTVTGSPTQRTLKILRDDRLMLRVDYPLEVLISPEEDPTPFAADEDFDFGLFVRNIAGDEKRQKILHGRSE